LAFRFPGGELQTVADSEQDGCRRFGVARAPSRSSATIGWCGGNARGAAARAATKVVVTLSW